MTREELLEATGGVDSRLVLSKLEQLGSDELADLYALMRPRQGPQFLDFAQATVPWRLHDWQRYYLVPRLQRLAFEEGARILFHAPPQYGKSVLFSQRFPAYVMGVRPTIRFGLACYNASHAEGFGRVVLDLMCSPEYQELFPSALCRTRKDDKASAFSTAARRQLRDAQTSFLAMGLNSGFTGKGLGAGDVLLIDDPYKSAEEALSKTVNDRVYRWWSQTAEPRIDPRANVALMFHRYHPVDVAGRLLAEGGWEYIRLPAIADENADGSDPTNRPVGSLLSPMRTIEWLLKKRDTDPFTFAGQFQGLPIPPGGELIKTEWFRRCTPEDVPKIKLWIRFWDLATGIKKTGDFTAGALLGIGPGQTVYLYDVEAFREEWPDAQERIATTTAKDAAWAKARGARYAVGIEKVAWQMAMIQDLQSHRQFRSVQLYPLPTAGRGDKKEWASPWITRAKIGQFYLVESGWDVQGFLKICAGFDGRGITKDDQIDGVSGAFQLQFHLSGAIPEEVKPLGNDTYEYFDKIFDGARERREQDS